MKNIINRKKFLIIKEEKSEDYNVDYMNIKIIILNFLEKNNLKTISFNNKGFEYNYDNDLEKLKNYLKEKGYDLDIIMQKYKDEIYSDSFFIETCAFLDYLLYSYDSNFPLSGMEIHDSGLSTDVLMKYNYNFTQYKLGKLYLLQNYKTIYDFYVDCAKNFVLYLDELGIENIKMDDIYKENDYVLSIMNIHNVSDRNKLKDELDGYKNSYLIEGDILIVAFGDNPKLDKIPKEVRIKISTSKYNL